jgi:hypothetical protein
MSRASQMRGGSRQEPQPCRGSKMPSGIGAVPEAGRDSPRNGIMERVCPEVVNELL